MSIFIAVRPVAKVCVCVRGCTRGNASRQIYNLTRQINEVSLGSLLIFRELGLTSSSFMLKNLGKAILEAFQRGLISKIFSGSPTRMDCPHDIVWYELDDI